jgi:hypothetical protein
VLRVLLQEHQPFMLAAAVLRQITHPVVLGVTAAAVTAGRGLVVLALLHQVRQILVAVAAAHTLLAQVQLLAVLV